MKYKFIATGLLLAFSTQVMADIPAGRPEFNWVNPTTWTDGSPVSASQITGYQLNCTGAITINQRLAAGSGVPPSTYPPAASPPLGAGNYTCNLAVYGRMTPTSPEALSAASSNISFTVPQPRMNAPTGFSAN